MDDERFTTPHETSQSGCAPSTNQRLAYATQRAEVLFGCYRKGDANDPDRYVTSIAAVLTLYDFEIMREATDPRTGIQTTEKFAGFMPNAGELKLHCEAIASRKQRMADLAKIPRPVPASHRLEAPEAPPGAWANVFVPETNQRYAGLVEWSNTAEQKFWKFGTNRDGEPGIWIPHNVWDTKAERKPVARGEIDWSNLKASDALSELLGGREPPTADEQVPFE